MKKGFTLIELLVVLAIIAILVAICWPVVDHFLHPNRVNGLPNQSHSVQIRTVP